MRGKRAIRSELAPFVCRVLRRFYRHNRLQFTSRRARQVCRFTLDSPSTMRVSIPQPSAAGVALPRHRGPLPRDHHAHQLTSHSPHPREVRTPPGPGWAMSCASRPRRRSMTPRRRPRRHLPRPPRGSVEQSHGRAVRMRGMMCVSTSSKRGAGDRSASESTRKAAARHA